MHQMSRDWKKMGNLLAKVGFPSTDFIAAGIVFLPIAPRVFPKPLQIMLEIGLSDKPALTKKIEIGSKIEDTQDSL